MTADRTALIAQHQSWRDHATASELHRLEVLEARIDRKRRSLDETLSERHALMERLQTRMKAAANDAADKAENNIAEHNSPT